MNPISKVVTIKSSDLVVKRFEQVVERNFHDRRFCLTQMAAGMAMSERQLQRKLRSFTGQTPTEIVRTFRLSRSLEYLLAGASIRDTARAVGFSSQAYFASCFKAEYGRTPSEYRERRNILI
jgi:AraC-like DNA-binding protein